MNLVMSVLKHWREVTSADIERALHGTAIEPVVRALQSPTDPPLPLPAVLGKAFTIAGSLLAKPRDGALDDEGSGHGVDLARFRINSGYGQVTNMWSLTVGRSGAGKDIGQLASRLPREFNNLIGTSGSAAGLCDAYMENGAGVLVISEFEPYLDKKCWQSAARPMLTNAFNQGDFDVRLTGKGRRKVCRYCYPSIIANIQPEVLTRHAGSLDVMSGFIPRFLISTIPQRDDGWSPVTGKPSLTAAYDALRKYNRIAGEVTPPRGYPDAIRTFLQRHKANSLLYGRYINEYAPRIACVLQGDGRSIRNDTWNRTAMIILWFYAMAEEVMGGIQTAAEPSKLGRNLLKLLNYIRKKTLSDGGVTKTTISQNNGDGTTAAERDRILDELVARGKIRLEGIKFVAVGA